MEVRVKRQRIDDGNEESNIFSLCSLPLSFAVELSRLLRPKFLYRLTVVSRNFFFVFGSDLIWAEKYKREHGAAISNWSDVRVIRLFSLYCKYLTLAAQESVLNPNVLWRRGCVSCSFGFGDFASLSLLSSVDSRCVEWAVKLSMVVTEQQRIERRLERLTLPADSSRETMASFAKSVVVHWVRNENDFLDARKLLVFSVRFGNVAYHVSFRGHPTFDPWDDPSSMFIVQLPTNIERTVYMMSDDEYNVVKHFESLRRCMGFPKKHMRFLIEVLLVVVDDTDICLDDFDCVYEDAKCSECGKIHEPVIDDE